MARRSTTNNNTASKLALKELPGGNGSARRRVAKSELPDVRSLIAEAAYFKAQSRGFSPGLEMQDWLEAEQEVQGLSGDS